jgi:hypothetical protein
MPSFQADELPVLWVKRPDNLPLPIAASVEPISMAVSAILASLTIIVLIFLTLRTRRSRKESVHLESEETKSADDIQAAVGGPATSQPIEAHASEGEPTLQAPSLLNDIYESSEAKTSDNLAELKHRYERQVAEMEAQITFRMSGQTPHCSAKDIANTTANALSVSNYSISEMCTEKERDYLGAPDGGRSVRLKLCSEYDEDNHIVPSQADGSNARQ